MLDAHKFRNRQRTVAFRISIQVRLLFFVRGISAIGKLSKRRCLSEKNIYSQIDVNVDFAETFLLRQR